MSMVFGCVDCNLIDRVEVIFLSFFMLVHWTHLVPIQNVGGAITAVPVPQVMGDVRFFVPVPAGCVGKIVT